MSTIGKEGERREEKKEKKANLNIVFQIKKTSRKTKGCDNKVAKAEADGGGSIEEVDVSDSREVGVGQDLQGIRVASHIEHELVQWLGTDDNAGDVVGLHAQVHEHLAADVRLVAEVVLDGAGVLDVLVEELVARYQRQRLAQQRAAEARHHQEHWQHCCCRQPASWPMRQYSKKKEEGRRKKEERRKENKW